MEGNHPAAGSSATSRASIAWPSTRTSRLADRQRLTRGDAQLELHQVQAGDGLGDRVLHL